MYGLCESYRILRFVNYDEQACIDFPELFELTSNNFCFMNLKAYLDISKHINLHLNQVMNNN